MDDWEGEDERPLSLNKYNYTEGNPVMRTDPSGNDWGAGLAIGLGIVLAVGEVYAQIAEPAQCLNNCPNYHAGKKVRNEAIEPDAEYLSAMDVQEYTTTWKNGEVKKWEMLSEIYKIQNNCLTFEEPYTNQYLNAVRYQGVQSSFVRAYWHNHPLIPLYEKGVLRNDDGSTRSVTGDWYEKNAKPFAFSSGDLGIARMENINAYMTVFDSRSGYDNIQIYPMIRAMIRVNR